MYAGLRPRFWLEVTLATAGAVCFGLTVAWHDWLELAFRVDPDQQSGALEWVVAAGFVALACGLGAAARREWRRAGAPASVPATAPRR